MGFVELETLFSAKRGERYARKLKEQYPDGIVGTVGEVYMARMKCWDGKRRKANRSWNIVAWRDNSGYPHTIKNEVLWRLFLIFPIRWEHINQFRYLDDVYEVVYHARLLKEDGKPYPFVLSLFPDEAWWIEERKVRIREFGCVAHPLHRFLIGSDYEIYPKDVEVLD